MRIAIIGARNVGRSLGQRFAKLGHHVVFGVRRKQFDGVSNAIDRIGHGVELGIVSEAIDEGEIVVLALPYAAALEAASSEPLLAGKIVIDVTNPLSADASELVIGHNSSAAESLQAAAPKARLVKAFSTTGAENMLRPQYATHRLAMPVAGDDANAKEKVLELAEQLGFDAIDAGSLKQARLLEPMAMLWISLAYARGFGRDIGFALLRKDQTS
jgi:8-hydroxy-5-deazaflavin:NADPH oxidoreductase